MIVLRADLVREPPDLYHLIPLIYPHVTGKAVDSPAVMSTITRKLLRLVLVPAATGLIVSAIMAPAQELRSAKPSCNGMAGMYQLPV